MQRIEGAQTPEAVAFNLMLAVVIEEGSKLTAEQKANPRKYLLEAYRDAISVVKGTPSRAATDYAKAL
jgi:hypothetical protein